MRDSPRAVRPIVCVLLRARGPKAAVRAEREAAQNDRAHSSAKRMRARRTLCLQNRCCDHMRTQNIHTVLTVRIPKLRRRGGAARRRADKMKRCGKKTRKSLSHNRLSCASTRRAAACAGRGFRRRFCATYASIVWLMCVRGFSRRLDTQGTWCSATVLVREPALAVDDAREKEPARAARRRLKHHARHGPKVARDPTVRIARHCSRG